MLAQDGTNLSFGPAIAAIAAVILVAGPLSVAVTYVVDFIRNAFDRTNSWPSWVTNVVALVLGVGLAFGWGINLLKAVVAAVPTLSDKAGTHNELGMLLTGLIIGAMAGFWHDKMSQWSAWAAARRNGNPMPVELTTFEPEVTAPKKGDAR